MSFSTDGQQKAKLMAYDFVILGGRLSHQNAFFVLLCLCPISAYYFYFIFLIITNVSHVKGGPSGCYLAKRLQQRFPQKSILLVNNNGVPSPELLFKTFLVNLVAVVVPGLSPSFKYTEKHHPKQVEIYIRS
jgi:hypothetical protein